MPNEVETNAPSNETSVPFAYRCALRNRQEMMERAARIQTIEELREVSAELGLELSPEKEAAFMAVRTAEGELTEQQLDATVGGAYHVVSPSDVCDFQASETKCCATCKYGQFDWPNYYCVVTL